MDLYSEIPITRVEKRSGKRANEKERRSCNMFKKMLIKVSHRLREHKNYIE